jgi:hypothetical protein
MQWQKSPQYQNMPHQQYMQTAEGQRSRQAFQRWNDWQMGSASARPTQQPAPAGSAGKISMSAYAPGRAQPMQPQSQGTPYQQTNRPTASNRPATSGQQPIKASPAAPISARPPASPPSGVARLVNDRYRTSAIQRPQQRPVAAPTPGPSTYSPNIVSGPSYAALAPSAVSALPHTMGSAYSEGYRPPAVQPTPQQPDGNLAYAPPYQRPPPFQAAYGQIGGGYAPQQNAGQRDAFISNINDQLGRAQQQSWASPGSVGAPQFNFGQLWGQAGDMVQQGWQSPLAGLYGSKGNAQPYGKLNSQFTGPPPPPGILY